MQFLCLSAGEHSSRPRQGFQKSLWSVSPLEFPSPVPAHDKNNLIKKGVVLYLIWRLG